VTVIPWSVANCSLIWNLISQDSTSPGTLAELSCTSLEYFGYTWLNAFTWSSSCVTVMRSEPTMAAEPILTGEHAVATASTTPTAAAHVNTLRNTGNSSQSGARTERTTSAHQASSSVSRSGWPPKGAVFGTGTSIVRTCCFSTVFGYSRWSRT
jgi:hypothetical protein